MLSKIRNRAGDRAIDGLLLSQDSAVSDWPQVKLGKTGSYYMSQGNPVRAPQSSTRGNVRIYGVAEDDAEGEVFLGVGEITDDGLVAPKRLVKG